VEQARGSRLRASRLRWCGARWKKALAQRERRAWIFGSAAFIGEEAAGLAVLGVEDSRCRRGGVLPGGEAGARRKQCAEVAVARHDVGGVVWLARREARRDAGGVAVLAASWKGGIGGWVAAWMDDGVGSGCGCWYF